MVIGITQRLCGLRTLFTCEASMDLQFAVQFPVQDLAGDERSTLGRIWAEYKDLCVEPSKLFRRTTLYNMTWFIRILFRRTLVGSCYSISPKGPL